MRKLIKLAITGSTAGALCLGLGSANIAANACPTSHAPTNAANTTDPGYTVAGPVYAAPDDDPARAAGYVGVDFASTGVLTGSIEANSGTQDNPDGGGSRPPASEGSSYVVAQGDSPAGSGGIIVYDPSGANAGNTGTC